VSGENDRVDTDQRRHSVAAIDSGMAAPPASALEVLESASTSEHFRRSSWGPASSNLSIMQLSHLAQVSPPKLSLALPAFTLMPENAEYSPAGPSVASEPVIRSVAPSRRERKPAPPPLQLGALSNLARHDFELSIPLAGQEREAAPPLVPSEIPIPFAQSHAPPMPMAHPPSLVFSHMSGANTDTPVSPGPSPFDWFFPQQPINPVTVGASGELNIFSALEVAADLGGFFTCLGNR
jgi:hypothetical protein